MKYRGKKFIFPLSKVDAATLANKHTRNTNAAFNPAL